MARIATNDPQSSTGKAKTLLDAVQSKNENGSESHANPRQFA